MSESEKDPAKDPAKGQARDPARDPARKKPVAAIKRRSIAGLLASNQRGAILVFFALILPILIGFMGLAVEVGYWASQHRNLQSAADAAAIAGSYDLANAGTNATREATNNGWNSTDGTITVRGDKYNSTFPATGAYTTNDNAIEVVLSYDVDRMFSGYFINGRMTLDTRAVGLSVAGKSVTCVLALGAANQQGALKVTGKFGGVIMDGCSMATNSTNSQAVKNMVTGSNMVADCIYSAGDIAGSVTTTVCAGGPYSDQPPVIDPYEEVPKPAPSEFDNCTDLGTFSSDTTISPGVYCGIKVTGGNLTMSTGVYFLDGSASPGGGDFAISGNSTTVDADPLGGVTIIFGTSSGGDECGGVTYSADGAINITATTGGTYGGFAFYRSSNCSSNVSFDFTGDSDSNIEGVIYNPSGGIDISGQGKITGKCLQIVADTIDFNGQADVGSDCDDLPDVKTILSGGVGSLVE